jgi:hypothetical protein
VKNSRRNCHYPALRPDGHVSLTIEVMSPRNDRAVALQGHGVTVSCRNGRHAALRLHGNPRPASPAAGPRNDLAIACQGYAMH